ncbi:hypothetical protein GOODEAATRI_009411 [Goodea atripinnis]|uniref:TIR domain-containing protein n=1 Tax=Goodea atripinnis TaxID=208336 RepID=A0ABV0PMC6_9TELE
MGLLPVVCKTPTLRGLIISQSHFANFTIELASCVQLRELNLEDNFMSELSKGSMQSMKQLRFLNLGYNLFTEFPHDIRNLSSLEILKMHHNDISGLSCDDFSNTTHLKELYLNMNRITQLQRCITEKIVSLKVLDVSGNLLKANLSALRYLKLTDNEISVISETVFQSLPSLRFLDLDNNPFSCECSNAGFIHWIVTNSQTQVVKAYQYKCFFPVSKRGNLLLDFDIQSCRDSGSFLCFISSTCLVVLTLLISFIYNFLRLHLSYTFHLFVAFLYDSRKRKKGHPHWFDAFVSYNAKDEDWVYREMLPVLEGEQGWRLCLHHRDFQPGKPIIENITDAIYGSRKTICVISRSYLQSEWCSREIQMASFHLFDEQKDVLILLFLEEIPPHHLSPYYRMRKLVKKRTYLSWPQAVQHPGVFWQNVQRALQTGDALTEITDPLTGLTGC